MSDGRFLILAILLFLVACEGNKTRPVARVVADGLLNPVGLTRLPDGGLLIAEMGTGMGDDSAGVTLITTDGKIGRFISHIASTRDSGDLAGAALVGIDPDGQTLYVGNFNAARLWTWPIDTALALPDKVLTTDMLGIAMAPQVIDQLINPFDIAFTETGAPIVTDASMNGLARQTDDGKTQFIYHFPRLPDPTDNRRTIDAVPTGIARLGNEYLVTLTGGCPFPVGGGQLVAIGERWRSRIVVADLNMPIDVAIDSSDYIWVLEFAEFRAGGDCFAGGDYLPTSGRLSRLDAAGQLQPVITGLTTPGAFMFADDDTIVISEVFSGRIVAVQPPTDETLWPISVADIRPNSQTLTAKSIPIATLTPKQPLTTEKSE
ncbi:MAG: ScyD/ScyE family protein [Anaerolineae bacterium]|nr:ScyD/ScyE family protein [Anaerolineae bacterium]